MKKTIVTSAIIAASSFGSLLPAADVALDERLAGLVSRGRVSVLDLSERQQESFGIASLQNLLIFEIADAGDSVGPAEAARIRFYASQLAAISLANTAAESDLTRAEYRGLRRSNLRARINPLIDQVAEDSPQDFEDAVAQIIEQYSPQALTEEQLDENLVTLTERRDSFAQSIEQAISDGTPEAFINRRRQTLARLDAAIASLKFQANAVSDEDSLDDTVDNTPSEELEDQLRSDFNDLLDRRNNFAGSIDFLIQQGFPDSFVEERRLALTRVDAALDALQVRLAEVAAQNAPGAPTPLANVPLPDIDPSLSLDQLNRQLTGALNAVSSIETGLARSQTILDELVANNAPQADIDSRNNDLIGDQNRLLRVQALVQALQNRIAEIQS